MLHPKHSIYKVKRGDCLSRIALEQYGDASVWPEIAKTNHIPNGNLILIGMQLRLPIVGNGQPAPHPSRPGKPVLGSHVTPRNDSPHAHQFSNLGHAPVARAVAFPAVKYDLSRFPKIVRLLPFGQITFSLTGEMTIQEKGAMTEVEFSKDTAKVSGTLKKEYDSKMQKLTSELKVDWDPKDRHKVGVSLAFTTAAKWNGQEFFTAQHTFIPPNKYKYTLKPRPIQGQLGNTEFSGSVGYEIEIEAKGQGPTAFRIPVPTAEQVRWVAIGGCVVVGSAIIVADIVKNVGTLGVGTVESPLSWAAAMSLFSRAAMMAAPVAP